MDILPIAAAFLCKAGKPVKVLGMRVSVFASRMVKYYWWSQQWHPRYVLGLESILIPPHARCDARGIACFAKDDRTLPGNAAVGGDRARLVCWSKDLEWEKVISHGRFCKKILRKAIDNVSGIQMLPKYVVPKFVTPLCSDKYSYTTLEPGARI